jgi:predicted phosphoribosyltransferase
MRYVDRRHAGETLVRYLTQYASRQDIVVLGMVRGGVPVAAPVAEALKAPLDVLVIRKLGVPWSPEVAFGALGPDGVVVVNPRQSSAMDPAQTARVVAEERAELIRREARYRPGRPPVPLDGRVALVVDDGLATGASARAAVAAARRSGAAAVVVAVPVGAPETVALIAGEADEVICPLQPADFIAVGYYYDQFAQVRDAEVVALLSDRD